MPFLIVKNNCTKVLYIQIIVYLWGISKTNIMKANKKLLGMTLLASPFIGLFTWFIIVQGFINFLFFIGAVALLIGIIGLGMHLIKD